jgi:hypothetical protein
MVPAGRAGYRDEGIQIIDIIGINRLKAHQNKVGGQQHVLRPWYGRQIHIAPVTVFRCQRIAAEYQDNNSKEGSVSSCILTDFWIQSHQRILLFEKTLPI